MNVECSSCRAPIPAKPGATVLTCLFCKAETRLAPDAGAMAQAAPLAPFPTFGASAAPYQPFPMPPDVRSEAPRGHDVPQGSGGTGGVVVLAVVGLAIGAIIATVVLYQTFINAVDLEARPVAGVMDLATLSSTEPHTVTGDVAGSVDATDLDASCRGYFERAPTVVLHVVEPTLVSFTTTHTTEDLTLGIRAANGTAFCDDDGGEGTNPRLAVTLGPGDYPVWVGTYHDDESSRFTFTLQHERAPNEVARGMAIGASSQLGSATAVTTLANLPPSGGVLEVPSGVGTLQSRGIAGGMVNVSNVGTSCRGYAPAAPHVSFLLRQATSLSITTSTTDTSSDLTLIVRGSDGRVRCDDDSGHDSNGLIADAFPPGRVDVWVGDYHEGEHAIFALTAEHESAAPGAREHGLAVEAPPTLGTIDTATLGDGWTHAGVTRGRVEARAIDPHCSGMFPAVATLVLNVSAPGDFSVGTRSSEDLVMAIRHPDGTFTCDDDSEGNQPRIAQTFALGEHRIWVGTFTDEGEDAFELRVNSGIQRR